MLETGLDGRGPIWSADRIARAPLRAGDDSEAAIERLVRDHLARSAVGGFATGVGGYVTLPVALPVNLAEFYILAIRMVGAIAIAIVRGYDVRQPEVRTAVLLTLVNSRSDQVPATEGLGAGILPGIALRRMPPGALMLVNKAIVFRLMRPLNEQVFSGPVRGLVFLNGGIGTLLARIAGQALVEYPPRDANASLATS